MNARNMLSVDRLVRLGLPMLGLLAATVVAAPPTDTDSEAPPAAVADNPAAPDSEPDGLLTDNPGKAFDNSLFDQLESPDDTFEFARYKYSVRYAEGKRRKLETVLAASEPLAYRKVREKHPEADSILLIEVRREGDRVDRSRRDRNSGQILNGPLGRRRVSLDHGPRQLNSIFPLVTRTVSSGPELPFGKLIDQMHKQNIQNILRGKTFEDSNMRMQQMWIELQQRLQATARARQQVLAAQTGGGSGSGPGKTTFSKGNSKGKQKLGDRVKEPRGGKSSGSGGPGVTDGPGDLPGEGDSDIGLGTGIPITPKF